MQLNFCKEKVKLDFSFGVEGGRCFLSDLHLWDFVLKLGKGLIFHVIVTASSLLSCVLLQISYALLPSKLSEKGFLNSLYKRGC